MGNNMKEKAKDTVNKAENKMHEVKGRAKQKAKDIKKSI